MRLLDLADRLAVTYPGRMVHTPETFSSTVIYMGADCVSPRPATVTL
jgi:hypothetical protein